MLLKKRLSLLIVILMIIPVILSGCRKEKTQLTQINLVSVTLSPYYAPLLVSLSQNYFSDEGLEVSLSVMESNSKIMQNVMAGACDIGFGGPEQVVFTYFEQSEDSAVIFAQANQKNGAYLLSQAPIEQFSFRDLEGATVIGGRVGGTQQNALEYAIKQDGADIGKIDMITNIALDSVPGAFARGEANYAVMFEPAASVLIDEGQAYRAISLGDANGYALGTSFYTRNSYIEENEVVISAFIRAFEKGLNFVQEHTPEETAKIITHYFPDIETTLIADCIEEFRAMDAYSSTSVVKESQYNTMLNIIESHDAALLPYHPAIDKIVFNPNKSRVLP